MTPTLRIIAVGLAVDLHARAGVVLRIVPGDLPDDALALLFRGQRHVESGGEALEFLRQADFMAEEDD